MPALPLWADIHLLPSGGKMKQLMHFSKLNLHKWISQSSSWWHGKAEVWLWCLGSNRSSETVKRRKIFRNKVFSPTQCMKAKPKDITYTNVTVPGTNLHYLSFPLLCTLKSRWHFKLAPSYTVCWLLSCFHLVFLISCFRTPYSKWCKTGGSQSPSN